MKCEICGKKIETTFLKKVLGTYVKNKKGKKILICSECQAKYKNDKTKLLEKI